MIATYKAHLLGNKLDWEETAPPDSTTTVSVLVTVLPSTATAQNQHVPSGRKLADILRRLANENSAPSISDPSAWQQEMRSERTLPGREV